MAAISLEQTAPTPGAVSGNVADIHQRLNGALSAGADLVVFPELAPSGYTVDRDVMSRSAQTVDGSYVGGLVDVLSGRDALVVTGLLERDGSEFYNSVVVVGADGPLLTYRKVHLFDREQEVYAAGSALPIVDTAHGVLGICICYDLRFVEVMRILALQGADIVVAPAAWVSGFDQPSAMETAMVPQAAGAVLQANLNQVAVIAVSQVGGVPGSHLLGGSVAVDSYGNLLAPPLPRAQTASVLVDVDVDEVRGSRSRGRLINPRTDRRRDVYGIAYREQTL